MPTRTDNPVNIQIRTTDEFNRQLNALCKAKNLRKTPVIFQAVKEAYDRLPPHQQLPGNFSTT